MIEEAARNKPLTTESGEPITQGRSKRRHKERVAKDLFHAAFPDEFE